MVVKGSIHKLKLERLIAFISVEGMLHRIPPHQESEYKEVDSVSGHVFFKNIQAYTPCTVRTGETFFLHSFTENRDFSVILERESPSLFRISVYKHSAKPHFLCGTVDRAAGLFVEASGESYTG